MNRKKLLRLYDREYASIYDESFLLCGNFKECTEFEVSLIAGFLKNSRKWLDVACGTGYFLSRFPGVDRCGLDISPAMLEVARRENPGVAFLEGDFLSPVPEWRNGWDLVSCMWYAYCYAGSIPAIKRLVFNLASWSSAEATCFVPVCDPDVLCKTRIAFEPPPDSNDGRLQTRAVVWNWIDEPSGKRHTNLIAPHLELMVSMFRQYFHEVNLICYPRFSSDCLESRKAIIAKRKRFV